MNFRLFLTLLAAGLTPTRAGAQPALPGPDIQAGRALEFQSVDGAAYVVEGSADGAVWSQVAGPLFGHGGPLSALLPAAAEGLEQYRVRPVSASAYGPATTLLGGKTVSLNEGGQVRQVILFPAIQGVRRGVLKVDASHARSFVWSARRLDGARVQVTLQYFDGTSSTVDLAFSNHRLGAYQMKERDVSGTIQVTEGGPFSLHEGRIRDAEHEAVLPAMLAGQSLLFAEGGTMTRFDFGTDGTVTLNRPDGTVEVQRYHYDRYAPGSADLRVETPGVKAQILQMEAGSQATGTYQSIPLVLPGGGILPGFLPQPGVFNIPTAPVVGNSNQGPPKSLGGKVLQLEGDEPVTLIFNNDGTGMLAKEDNGSMELVPFNYDYSPTDDDEASLALTFPGARTDQVEDYDLEFEPGNRGSFRRSNYNGGELANASSGTFNTGTP